MTRFVNCRVTLWQRTLFFNYCWYLNLDLLKKCFEQNFFYLFSQNLLHTLVIDN